MIDLDDDELLDDNPIDLGNSTVQETNNDVPLDEDINDNPPPLDDQIRQETNTDVITEFLHHIGILNPDEISFTGDNDLIETHSWNDLSPEEQLNILKSSITVLDDSTNLDPEEIEFINYLRSNRLTPKQYVTALSLQVSLQPVLEQVYAVDGMSDDELYLYDLQTKVGELTEDLMAEALTNAKLNEEIYQKLIDGIRLQYLAQEQLQQERYLAEQLQAWQDAYNSYAGAVTNAISGLSNIGNLDVSLDLSEAEELAEFMLRLDDQGLTSFSRAMQDEETAVKLAWFALNGDRALDNISQYYENLIKLANKAGYEKGLQDGAKKSLVVILLPKDTKTNNLFNKVFKSLADLDD